MNRDELIMYSQVKTLQGWRIVGKLAGALILSLQMDIATGGKNEIKSWNC